MEQKTIVIDELSAGQLPRRADREGGSAESHPIPRNQVIDGLLDRMLRVLNSMNQDAPNITAKQLADAQEIITALVVNSDVHEQDVAEQIVLSQAANGTLNNPVYVDTVTLPSDSPLAEEFSEQPNRYPVFDGRGDRT